MRIWLLLLLWFVFPLPSLRAEGEDVVSVSFPASKTPGALAIESKFNLWIPPNARPVRAIIVHQHGCGEATESFGDRAALDWHWRALAARHHAALLSPRYTTRGAECRTWCDPRHGSDAAFLQALEQLAIQSRHPELATAPWCLWGHSGGGFWVSLMLEKYPDRIVAAFCRSGAFMKDWLGQSSAANFPPAAYTVPVLLNPGLLERDDTNFAKAWQSTSNFFALFRAQGAPAIFAPDPLSNHECRNSRLLAIPFFDACLSARLPKQGNELRPVASQRAWMGDWQTGTVQPRRGDSSAFASWLPNESFARVFAEYVTTGKTTDRSRPPKPPVITSIKRTADGIQLTWTAEADLESGIRQFAVYRDGDRIALWPEKLDEKTGFAQFQGISYHDTPVSPRPPLAFTDRTAAAEARPRYALTLINGAGLESRRSKAVRP